MGDTKGLAKKIQDGDAVERDAVLCAECPLYGMHVPIDGTCIDLTVDERNSEPDFKGSPEDVVMPNNLTGYAPGVWYKVSTRCEHALSVSMGGITRTLRGVLCDYKLKDDIPA